MDLNVMVKPAGVVAATAAGYVLGAIWYAPPVFGNRWMAALGKTKEQLGSPARAMGLTLITCLISAWVLAVILARAGVGSAMGGAVAGVGVGLGVYGLNLYSDSLFAGISLRLILIQAGYRASQYALMGAILGAWK
jgi:hypothetical protein